jgi:hypothetical protein
MGTGGLLLAGLAAFAYYKYSKMSADQKKNIVSDLKEKGKKIYDDYAPQEVKNMFEKKQGTNAGSQFGQGSTYTG